MEKTRTRGICIPEILVPEERVKMEKWSCVACDQFSSQEGYWREVAKLVGNAPSMLNIILPEVYLGSEGMNEDIKEMKLTMEDYVKNGVLTQLPQGLVLTERTMDNVVRKGLLLCVDLEEYHYDISKNPYIRATEKTLLERIPPRVSIRSGALVESPHILVLMDDPSDSVIGPLYSAKDSLSLLYDFELMMGGGRLASYFTEDPSYMANVIDAIDALEVRDGMRFCVGDGNHSLATAKAVWDAKKESLSESERENHPLRYALCEFVNIRDAGIEFMPIHRVLFKVQPTKVAQYIIDELGKKGVKAKLIYSRWRNGAEAEDGDTIPFLSKEGSGKIVFENRTHPLLVGEVQDILDMYIKENPGSEIDYIHGSDAFNELCTEYDNFGLFFPAMRKDEFFDTVIKCGVLPKKSFSLGEAEQKRYYTECRLIGSLEE